MFFRLHTLGQTTDVVALEHRYRPLSDNGACVHACIDEMDGASAFAGTGSQNVAVGVGSGKRWKQRGMDVEQPTFPACHKGGRQQAHPSGEDHGLNVVRFQDVLHLCLVRKAAGRTVVEAGQRDDFNRASERLGAGDGSRIRFVGQHKAGDVQDAFFLMLVTDQCFHSRARPGGQHGQAQRGFSRNRPQGHANGRPLLSISTSAVMATFFHLDSYPRSMTKEPPLRLSSVDEVMATYAISASPVKRVVFLSLGLVFIVFAVIGIWVPGWPTVSWAVPAAFFFSMSSPRLFRWTMENRWFGNAIFDYYATGKTVPKHAKYGIAGFITASTLLSAYGVWEVSVRGEGVLSQPSTWNGADPGFGPATVLLVGLVGVWFILIRVRTRET